MNRTSHLSVTSGELPSELEASGRARRLGQRVRAVLGWTALGTGFFLVFAWLSIPTQAIAWRLSHEAYEAGYKVDIEDVSLRPWGSITLENVTWTFEPTRPGTPPSQYRFDEIDVHVGLLALLGGNVNVEVDIEREQGTIHVEYVRSKDASSFALEVEDLPLYDVPKASQSFGVPLMGVLAITAKLELPEHKVAKAVGTIDITCAACRAGDGESKLFVPGSGSLSTDGLTIPEVDLGTIKGRFVVEEGRATLDPPIQTESEDLVASLNGMLALRDPFSRSQFNMILKVELTEAFQEHSDSVRFMYQGASDKSKLDPPERGLGYKLRGSITRPKFYGIKAVTPRERRADNRARARKNDERRRSSSRRTATPEITPEPFDDEPSPRNEPGPEVPSMPSGPPSGVDRPSQGRGIDVEPLDPVPEGPTDGLGATGPEDSAVPPNEPPPPEELPSVGDEGGEGWVQPDDGSAQVPDDGQGGGDQDGAGDGNG